MTTPDLAGVVGGVGGCGGVAVMGGWRARCGPSLKGGLGVAGGLDGRNRTPVRVVKRLFVGCMFFGIATFRGFGL